MSDNSKHDRKPERATINSLDVDGESYLHNLTSRQDSAELIKEAVFKLGADVNTLSRNGLPPLYSAISKGNLQAAQALLDCGARIHFEVPSLKRQFNAVCSATFYGNKDMLKLILNKGGAQHSNQAGLYFNSAEDLPALHLAVIYRSENLIPELLAAGAFIEKEVGKQKLTALHRAAAQKWSNAVPYLVKGGADLDRQQSENGNTALHLAAQRDNYDPLAALLKLGANPDIFNRLGYTPLMEAVAAQNITVIKCLLENGANPNLAHDASSRQTALHLAIVKKTSKEIITLLLENGADPLAADKDSRFPSYYLKDYSNRIPTPPYYYSSDIYSTQRVVEMMRKYEEDAKARFFNQAISKTPPPNKKFKM